MSAPVHQMPTIQRDRTAQLLEIAGTIRGLSQSASAAVIEIGRGRRRAKSLLNHGSFGLWVSSACGFTPRSAQNYIRAALLADGKSETVWLLPLGAIYLLSAKSTPPAVVSIVFEWLARGRIASETDVQLLVDQYRQRRRMDPTAAPGNSLRPELLRLLATASCASPRSKRDDDGRSQRAVLDLVRDAGDDNLFRAERDALEESQNTPPVCLLVDHSTVTTPSGTSTQTDDLIAGQDALAPTQAVSSADSSVETLHLEEHPAQSKGSSFAARIDFLTDTVGTLHGIPDFLRRPQTAEQNPM